MDGFGNNTNLQQKAKAANPFRESYLGFFGQLLLQQLF